MPNIKSAKKRLRQSVGRTAGNLALKTRVKTSRRKFFEAAAEGDAATLKTAYSQYCSALDRAVKRGVIKKNNATRRKSRAAAKLA